MGAIFAKMKGEEGVYCSVNGIFQMANESFLVRRNFQASIYMCIQGGRNWGARGDRAPHLLGILE